MTDNAHLDLPRSRHLAIIPHQSVAHPRFLKVFSLAWHIINNSLFEFLDIENLGIAVENFQLSILYAELYIYFQFLKRHLEFRIIACIAHHQEFLLGVMYYGKNRSASV